MDANLDKIAKDLYGKIQTRFPDIRIGDEDANVLTKKKEIPKARFFEFEYEENGEDIGTISITLDSDEGVVLEVSGDIVAKKHPGAFRFIRSFRQFAKDRLLNYDVKRMGKSNLSKRDYAFRSQVKDDMIMENKLYGTARISYQDLGEAQLIIKHSQPVNTELAAGRTMHIENIYIENAVGERFRYPAKHINGARALAEHIKHGGNPYDAIGQHIIGLSEELASLRKFKNYVGRQEQLSETMGDITTKVMERIEEIKKEVHGLQRSAYYEQFAESFEAKEEQLIPEEVMDDWIDRLTIRTFNEELKSVFPYIYKLVDETSIPVKELNPEDLLDEGGITLPNPDGTYPPGVKPFTIDDQIRLNQQVAASQQGRKTNQGQDLGDGFTLTTVNAFGDDQKAVFDTQSNTYIIVNKRADGTAIARTPAPYLTVDSEGKTGSLMKVGPQTQKALQKAGLAPQQENREEDYFENFINSIIPEDFATDDAEGPKGIFNPNTQQDSLDQLNQLLKGELKGGVDDVNFGKIKELIPDPEFISKLDQVSPDIDARSAIEVILNDLAKSNPVIGDLLASGKLDFGSAEEVPNEIGGPEVSTPEPATTAGSPTPAPEAPAEDPGAPEEPVAEGSDYTADELVQMLSGQKTQAQVDAEKKKKLQSQQGTTPPYVPSKPAPVQTKESDEPPFDGPYTKRKGDITDKSGAKHTGHSQARHLARQGLLKAIHKAKSAGAGLDTTLDFGHKKTTLLGAMQECGLDPSNFGFEQQSGINEILKSIAGFWNRDATITEGNFTIGPTRVKQKVVTSFKNGDYPNATKEDVSKVFSLVDKLDPPSNNQARPDIGHLKRMAGLPHNVEEDSDEEDFETMMKDFQAKHNDADLEQLFQKYKEIANTSSATQGAAVGSASDAEKLNPRQGAAVGGAGDVNQSGTIDGKPASYADAMAKFRDIAKGMKLKLPGSDQDLEFDVDNPEKMGQAIQGHVGNMMKGMQGQIPQGSHDIDMPGFTGKMDPQAMMKGIMDKMPKLPDVNGPITGKKKPLDMPSFPKPDKAGSKMGGIAGSDNPLSMEESNELLSMLKIAGLK